MIHLGGDLKQGSIRSPNSLESLVHQQQSNYSINKNTINNINKQPTNSHEELFFNTVIDKDNFPNSKNLQIPQLSTFKGDPQELVNILSARIYSLVEQIYKLSSIIEEMTTNQQILSEKYVQLRAIYYQVLIDRNLRPSEKDQQWLIMNKSQNIFNPSSPNSPRNRQEITDQVLNKAEQRRNTSLFNFHQQKQYEQQQQEAYRRVQFNSDDDEKVKKSRIRNLDQQQKETSKFCQNCQQREQEEQILKQHFSQMENNLKNANIEIQNLKELIEIQQKQQNLVKSILNSPNNSNYFQDNQLKRKPDSQQTNNFFKSQKGNDSDKSSPKNYQASQQQKIISDNNDQNLNKKQLQQQENSTNNLVNRTDNSQTKLDNFYKIINISDQDYLQKQSIFELSYQNKLAPQQSEIKSNIQSNSPNHIQKYEENDKNNKKNFMIPLETAQKNNQPNNLSKSLTPKSNNLSSYTQNLFQHPQQISPNIPNKSSTPKGNFDLKHNFYPTNIFNDVNSQPAYQILVNQYLQNQNPDINYLNNQIKSPKQIYTNVYSNLDTFSSIQPQKAKIDANNISLKDSIEVFKEYLHDQQQDSIKKINQPHNNRSPSKSSKINQTPSSNKSSKSKSTSYQEKEIKQNNNVSTNSILNQNNLLINPQYQQNPK